MKLFTKWESGVFHREFSASCEHDKRWPENSVWFWRTSHAREKPMKCLTDFFQHTAQVRVPPNNAYSRTTRRSLRTRRNARCTPRRLRSIGLCLLVLLDATLTTGSTVAADREDGYRPLFNGKNLDGWQLRRAVRKGYVVEKGLLVCPSDAGGYLLTTDQYSDFCLRFEFQLAEGANNGVAIRCPLVDTKPAYQGMEIQILDNPRYAGKLRPTQYHGSLYDVCPAKQGALKPVGEWNEQQILCQGQQLKVTLNKVVILDVNLGDVTDAAVRQKHPGLQRTKGYIGFLGHGSRVAFRHIRIKELKLMNNPG